jgi:alkanesulfonate monooxygenase SsuD/methylene tetrahydromethanopterin reductase-like flavin-dependent oxidoreductase (luciferase family)
MLGLGAAWNQLECGAYGISLASRMDRFAEGLEVIAGLLTNETTTFAGRFYQLTEARCTPQPVQRPRPPITIGGTGERRTLPLVARWADHWDLGFTPPAQVPHKLDLLAERCVEIGRNISDITVSVVIRTADGSARRDLREVVDEIRAYAAAGCQLAIVEALAVDADDASAEIDRLTEACAGV